MDCCHRLSTVEFAGKNRVLTPLSAPSPGASPIWYNLRNRVNLARKLIRYINVYPTTVRHFR